MKIYACNWIQNNVKVPKNPSYQKFGDYIFEWLASATKDNRNLQLSPLENYTR